LIPESFGYLRIKLREASRLFKVLHNGFLPVAESGIDDTAERKAAGSAKLEQN
jgi:hypothetical protein